MIKACRIKGKRFCQALCLLLLAACDDTKQPTTQRATVSLDAGTDSGPDASDGPRDIARALAMLEPTVAAESGDNGPIALTGTAALWEHGANVTLKLDVRGCRPGGMYRARVQDGSDCSEQTLAAQAWSAGEGIDDIFGCSNGSAFTAFYARREDHEAPWSIGGAKATNVVGHALILSEVATGEAVTCGVIERAPNALVSETTDSEGPTVQIRGAIAGVCVFDRQVPKKKEGCPDFAAATACGSTYCELNRCIDQCATYVQCMAQMLGVDACVASYRCDPSAECASCMSDVVHCEVDVCLETLSCADPPSPDGPCPKLQQCCTTEDTSCLNVTRDLARFGDAECQRLLESWRMIGKPCPAD